MCIKPTTIYLEKADAYEPMEVPCRVCWRCKRNRVNDLVGRAICEASTSDWTMAVTLTYDDNRIALRHQKERIVKSDFQNFMKLIRKDLICRYVVAGEFGEKKGRAHFHVLLFGLGRPPDIPNRKRFHWERYWPWGHVYADKDLHERSIRYVCKYMTKNMEAEQRNDKSLRQEWVSYSLKPLLGAEFIYQMAERQAEARVFPRTFGYRPPGVVKNPKDSFQFTGTAQFEYFDVLFDKWPEAWDAPREETMDRHLWRYVKHKMKKAWEEIPIDEQTMIMKNAAWNFRSDYTVQRLIVAGLSFHRRLSKMLEHEAEEVRKWRELQRAAARRGLGREATDETKRRSPPQNTLVR